MDILIDKYIMSLYQDMEDEVIADIARRVKKTGRYTETAELMAKSMHEQGFSPSKIQAEVMKMLRADKAYQMAVAENTKAYKQEIQDIIDETVKAAKEANDTLVAEAGNMAWNNDLSMWKEHGEDLTKPNNMSQLISAARLQTMGVLKNLTKTMGFRNTTLGTTGVLNAYQRELDLALIKVSTGTFSFDQAVNDCVHRLAQSGLRSIDYESGRTYQIDTAVRMNIRTGMSQLAGKVMEANLESSGQDLVITSQHMGSRPEHVPWQNKVFSYSGKSKKYPDFFKETGYGTVEGLKGANCTHDFYPFWEGASVIPEDIVEPDPVTIDGKEYTYYQATQKQRQMERNIRAIKREIEAQNAIGGPTTELRSKLKAQTNDYKQFSNKAGLKVRDNRLRVGKGTGIPPKNNDSSIRHRSGERVVRRSKADVNKNTTLTNKYGEEITFDIANAKNQERAEYGKKILKQLSNEYDTYLTSVGVGAKNTAGSVDGIDGRMLLNNWKPETFIHEFAHALTTTDRIKLGFADDKEIAFMNELKKIRKTYRAELYGNPKKGISANPLVGISSYADYSIDEFFAEAFAQAKMVEMGMELPQMLGTDTKYSSQVLALVNKYFGKKTLVNDTKSSTIKLDLQFFAKKHKSKKVPSDNPLWDSLVRGDVEQQLKDEIFQWEHGGYDYLIEIKDKYTYEILSKKKKKNIHE